MATFDSNIDINITLDSPPVTAQNFDVPLIAAQTLNAGFTERVRRYSNAAEAAADADLPQAIIDRVTAAFAQTLTPSEVAVGRADGLTADVWNVAISNPGGTGEIWTLTIDGTDYTYTVQAADTASDVVDGLIAASAAAPYTPTDNGADFDLTGTNLGQPLAVVLTPDPGGGSTGAGTATNTTPATTVFDGLTAIAAEDSQWYAVCLESRDSWNILEGARWTEANSRFLVAQSSDADILTGAATSVAGRMQALSYRKSTVMYLSNDLQFADVAWAANRMSINLDLVSTTWNNVTLVGITPDDDNVNTTQRNNALGLNANLYLTLYGIGSTGKGTVPNGDFIDLVITADWLKFRLEEDVANTLLGYSNRGRKVPYTDRGINVFVGLVRARVAQGVNAEHFVADTLNVNAPRAVDIDAATKQSRQLTFSFSVEPAGAIHDVTINGFVSFQT